MVYKPTYNTKRIFVAQTSDLPDESCYGLVIFMWTCPVLSWVKSSTTDISMIMSTTTPMYNIYNIYILDR